MSAMSIRGRKAPTVKELRAYLNEMEAAWTEEDAQYMGAFEDQQVLVPYFEQVPSSNRHEFRGYGPASVAFGENGMPDFIIDQPSED